MERERKRVGESYARQVGGHDDDDATADVAMVLLTSLVVVRLVWVDS